MRNLKQPLSSQKGFTIVELMTTIALLGALLMLALPSFKDAVERNSIRSRIKEMRVNLSEARDHATTLRTDVTICSSSNGTSCNGADWQEGLLAWADKDKDGALDADEIFMVRQGYNDNSKVTATATSVKFNASGAATAATEMRICPESKKVEYARGLVVQLSGVVRYSRDADLDGVHENNAGVAYTCP
ncbi:MAG TPA: GspH/FimT family pseudopilin [Pseudomonadales bacterium]|jgi:type IV fimbrial biogenesis protein FimT